MNSKASAAHYALALMVAAMAATIWVYWPGLTGSLLYDDQFNLAPVLLWDRDLMPWQEVLFGNPSGVLGRPVSMFSFLVTGMFGVEPFHFKLGNLLFHAANAVVAWIVLTRLFRLDQRLKAHAEMLAAVAVALWLVHPLHASTVLYAVQRMAQLSTLFCLAGVAIYLHARTQLYAGNERVGIKGLFLGVPAMLALGLFSKENAAVLPALCLVIELAFLGKPGPTPFPIRLFHLVFVILPALAVTTALVLAPDLLLSGYANRDFTLVDRLLTQPRALVDYLGQLLLPRGPTMTLYTDGYIASTGLLTPPSTLISLVGLSAISVLAIVLRRQAPLVFCGWFFFLAAHTVESSFIPLDLYYEHRNYLPSIGLVTAVTSAIALAALRLGRRSVVAHVGTMAVSACAIVALLVVSAGRAQAWASKDRLISEALEHHPNSLRVRLADVDQLRRLERFEDAEAKLDEIKGRPESRWRLLGHLEGLTLECLRRNPISPAAVSAVLANARPKLDIDVVQSAVVLLSVSRDSRCPTLSDLTIGNTLAQLADAAVEQDDAAYPKQQLRYAATIAYARSSLWPQALTQGQLAWQANAPMETGLTLLRIQLANGDTAAANATLALMAGRLRTLDSAGRRQYGMARQLLEQHEQQSH
jgi:hypothetical protein